MKPYLFAILIACCAAIGAHWSVLRAQESAPRSVWDGVYAREQADAGQGLYNQHCAACHGDTLAGGEMAPPLDGGNFLSNWNGLTVGDLFERIRTTMPLDNPQSLNRETNARILAYMLSFNRFPAGSAPLSSRTEVLKLIGIGPEKSNQNEQ